MGLFHKENYQNNNIDLVLRDENNSDKGEDKKAMSYKVGDIISFGEFYQDETKSPIKWVVLDIKEDKMLIISDQILYSLEFNCKKWNGSRVRKWLNKDFYSIAFNKNEKKRILTTFAKNPKNPKTLYGGSLPTLDKIFSLSFDEAYRYFSSNDGRRAVGTKYSSKSDHTYWLRTEYRMIDGEVHICCVDSDGEIAHRCAYGGVYDPGYKSGIRPAMWIKID